MIENARLRPDEWCRPNRGMIENARLRPDEWCRPNRGMMANVRLRPVGTRGGCGAGWGPCAQYISLKPKRGKKKTRKLLSGILPESKKKKPGAFDVQITRNGN